MFADLDTQQFDPFDVAEAVAAQVVQLAERTAAAKLASGDVNAICANVAASASRLLAAAEKAVDDGDTETALFALAAGHGAVTLIEGLLAAPNDPLLQHFAKPFVGSAA